MLSLKWKIKQNLKQKQQINLTTFKSILESKSDSWLAHTTFRPESEKYLPQLGIWGDCIYRINNYIQQNNDLQNIIDNIEKDEDIKNEINKLVLGLIYGIKIEDELITVDKQVFTFVMLMTTNLHEQIDVEFSIMLNFIIMKNRNYFANIYQDNLLNISFDKAISSTKKHEQKGRKSWKNIKRLILESH